MVQRCPRCGSTVLLQEQRVETIKKTSEYSIKKDGSLVKKPIIVKIGKEQAIYYILHCSRTPKCLWYELISHPKMLLMTKKE